MEEVRDILGHSEIRLLSRISHHGNSIFNHSLKVSFLAWRLARRFHLDARSTARGALLHDFFLYDWKTGSGKRRRFWELHRMHGFTHAREALDNADARFTLNLKEKNMILRHMFPLTPVPPLYPESWVVTICDKFVALCEIPHYLRHIFRC